MQNMIHNFHQQAGMINGSISFDFCEAKDCCDIAQVKNGSSGCSLF
jgi:hypothetical protein